MSKFRLYEILLYIFPVLFVWIVNTKFKKYFKFFKSFPLTLAQILVPLWLVLINEFGWVIYQMNVLPFVFFYLAFMLGLQLYDYVRRVNVFSIKEYFRPATHLIFSTLTAYLVGLGILRLLNYLGI